MKRGGPLRRRAPLRRVSPRRRARSPQLAKARAEVIRRSGGGCEAGLPGCRGWGDQAHHVLRRSQGGPDTAGNLRWVCSFCHAWVHQNVGEAVELGLLRHRAPLSSAVSRVERVA